MGLDYIRNIDLKNIYGISISDDVLELGIDTGCIMIPEDVYLDNKDFFDELIKSYCSMDRSNCFFKGILLNSSFHMSDEIFEIISKNSSLEVVQLCGFKINKHAFDIISRNSSIREIDAYEIDDDLFYTFDSRLTAYKYYELSDYLSLFDILFDSNLNIVGKMDEELSSYIIEFLKYRKIDGNITFYLENGSERYAKEILDEIFRLKTEEEFKSNIIFKVDRDVFLNTDYFTNVDANSIVTVCSDNDEEIDLNEFSKTNKEIRNLFGDYLEHKDELSPLESLLWAYSIVSSFRKYSAEGSNEDWKNSRLLHVMLFLDKVVCAGFTFLLSYIASDFDIINCFAATEDARKMGKHNHILNLIYFGDPKYDIDPGLYLLDSTFDNQTDKDNYYLNHFLIDPLKYRKHFKNIIADVFSLVGDCSEEEFNEILKNDLSLSLLVSILNKYYPDNELLNCNFSSSDSIKAHFNFHSNELFTLFRGISVSPISFDKIEQALVRVEKLKHPEMSDEDIITKVSEISDTYHKRDAIIYGSDKNKVKAHI